MEYYPTFGCATPKLSNSSGCLIGNSITCTQKTQTPSHNSNNSDKRTITKTAAHFLLLCANSAAPQSSCGCTHFLQLLDLLVQATNHVIRRIRDLFYLHKTD